MSQNDTQKKIIRTTALVTLVIILSKVFGLARDVITAGVYGTGMENDAYASAYTLFYLPVLMFTSCITATVVPLYTLRRTKEGLGPADRFGSNALNVFLLASLVISLLMYAFAEPIVRLIYKFDEAGVALTVRMTRIMMLGLIFNVASLVLTSLLNAMEQFMAAQLTGFPLSVMVILSVALFSKKLGVVAIAYGVLAASVLQALILIPFLIGRFHYKPVLDFKDGSIAQLLKLAGPALLSMGISEVNHLIDRSLASSLPTGSISAMNYGYKLITFLLGILMVPLTTVMFSRMSALAAHDDKSGLIASLRKSITLILLAALPVLAVGAVMSRDVIQLVYGRGSFGRESVVMTGGVLLFYIIGVPAFGLRDLLNRTFHALRDTRTPFYVSCMVVALNIVLNLILRRVMGANGLALATSIAGYCGLAALLILLDRRVGSLEFGKSAGELGRIFLATFVCAAVCFVMARVLPEAETTLGVFLRLCAATAASFIAYLGAAVALKCEGLGELIGAVKAKIKR